MDTDVRHRREAHEGGSAQESRSRDVQGRSESRRHELLVMIPVVCLVVANDGEPWAVGNDWLESVHVCVPAPIACEAEVIRMIAHVHDGTARRRHDATN